MVAMSVMTKAFDVTEAFALQKQHREHVRRRDDATPDERNSEEQLQRNGRADDFGQIARRDGDFAKDPQKPDGRRRVMVTAGLCQVASRGDAELDGQMLEQNRHEI